MTKVVFALSNGKKVGNFSSPHPFTFTDGNILPAVSDEDSLRLKIEITEKECGLKKGDIEITMDLSDEVISEMKIWEDLHRDGEVDVVFCPLMMITSTREKFGREYLLNSPFRTVRMEDRIKKLVSIDKQCL